MKRSEIVRRKEMELAEKEKELSFVLNSADDYSEETPEVIAMETEKSITETVRDILQG